MTDHMYDIIKQKAFALIQPAENGNFASRVFDCAIMGLIVISVVSIFAITFSLSPATLALLEGVETLAVVVFTVEYLLRLWTSDLLFPSEPRLRALRRYMLSPMAIIDLLAILPFYLPMLIPVNLLGLRALRLVRLLRIFKLKRYSDALASIGNVCRNKAKDIVASSLVILPLLLIASLLIYYAEHDAQPDKFANAFSGMWWAVATLTTVGYGDIYPVTPLGRLFGAVIAILGIGMVAIPTGIISSGFMEYLQQKGAQAVAEKAAATNDDSPEPNNADDDAAASNHVHGAVFCCPNCGHKLELMVKTEGRD